MDPFGIKAGRERRQAQDARDMSIEGLIERMTPGTTAWKEPRVNQWDHFAREEDREAILVWIAKRLMDPSTGRWDWQYKDTDGQWKEGGKKW